MNIAIEPFRDLESDLVKIIEEQKTEIDTFGLEIAPNWDQYRQLDDMDRLVCITARDPFPLIGYAISVIHNPIEFSSSEVMTNSAIYVAKDHRDKGVGKALVFAMETEAYIRKVHSIIWHTDVLNKHFGDLLSKNEYQAKDIIYIKKVR